MDHKEFSSKGGKAGKGESKRRSTEHYAKLAKAGVAARRMRRWAKERGTTLEAMAGDYSVKPHQSPQAVDVVI